MKGIGEPSRLPPLDADDWIAKKELFDAKDGDHGRQDWEREYGEAHLDVLHRRCDRRRQLDPDECRMLPCHGSDGASWWLEEKKMVDERRRAG